MFGNCLFFSSIMLLALYIALLVEFDINDKIRAKNIERKIKKLLLKNQKNQIKSFRKKENLFFVAKYILAKRDFVLAENTYRVLKNQDTFTTYINAKEKMRKAKKIMFVFKNIIKKNANFLDKKKKGK